MGKTALVTGASSGIGLELARLLAKDGYGLVLVARSEGKLRELAAELKDVPSLVIAADLARPEAPQQIFQAVQDAGLTVDVLINNAGFTVFGEFSDTDMQAEMNMLQVNIVALTALTKLFVTGMIARKSGRIMNVASTAAFQPGPLMACYYASKSYVLLFSEALACELEGTGVTVTTLCPGPTETGFVAAGGAQDSSLFKGKKVASAVKVALTGYRAMMRGQTIVIEGLKNAVMAFSVRLTPRWLVARIVKSTQARATH